MLFFAFKQRLLVLNVGGTVMKLATTTSDYFAYSLSHTDILKHIRKAGFRYADYNFGRDYNQRDGVYSENIELYLYTVANAAEKDGIKLIQAHSPMGKPLIKCALTAFIGSIMPPTFYS